MQPAWWNVSSQEWTLCFKNKLTCFQESSMQCCIAFRCSERSTIAIDRRRSQHLHRRTTEGAVVGRGRQGGETRAVAPVPPVLGAVLGQGREQGLTFSHFFFISSILERVLLSWLIRQCQRLRESCTPKVTIHATPRINTHIANTLYRYAGKYVG